MRAGVVLLEVTAGVATVLVAVHVQELSPHGQTGGRTHTRTCTHTHTHTHTHAHTGRFKGSIHKVRGVDVLFLSTQRRQPLLYRPSRETAPKCIRGS